MAHKGGSVFPWPRPDPAPREGAAVADVNAIVGWTTDEVARRLGVSSKTVRRLPIACIRIGYRTKRYLPEDVLAFLRSPACRRTG